MFSKACTYAIRAAIYLAVNGSEADKLGVKPLAAALEVPVHFLGKVLQEMARRELISSVKGPGGGFYLSEANRQKNLAQIIHAIDGPQVFTSCALGFDTCGNKNPCPVHHQVVPYRDGLKYQMEETTIDDMARRVERKHGKI